MTDTLNEQRDESCLWCYIKHGGEQLLVTLKFAGSLFPSETTVQSGIGLSDELRWILAIIFFSEDGKYQAFGGAHDLSDIFLAFLTRPRLYLKDLYSSICSIANYVSRKPRLRAPMQPRTWAMLSFPLVSVLTGTF